nr:substrate-binding domain-containing protein [Candidatus Nanopelagicales bacterium]
MRKSLVALAAATSALLVLGGCSTESETATESAAPTAEASGAAGGQTTTTCAPGDRIAVSLPAQTSENWTLAKAEFDAGLEAAGYTPDVQFSDSGSSAAASQQQKIDNMLTQGAKVLVIGAEDGKQLSGQVS